jgi:hypothetical protein
MSYLKVNPLTAVTAVTAEVTAENVPGAPIHKYLLRSEYR